MTQATRGALRLRITVRDEVSELALAPGERLRLGRDEADGEDGVHDADGARVCVVRGRLTSRRHAELALAADGSRATVRDLGSRGGILRGGAALPADATVALHSGDVLEVGDAEVAIVEAPGLPADAREAARAAAAASEPGRASSEAGRAGSEAASASSEAGRTSSEATSAAASAAASTAAARAAERSERPKPSGEETSGAAASTASSGAAERSERPNPSSEKTPGAMTPHEAEARGGAAAMDAARRAVPRAEGGLAVLAERAGLAAAPTQELSVYLERDDGGLALVAASDVALVVGRGQDVEVMLDDTTASRRHCRLGESVLRHAPSPFVVEDLESRGGTWLNGQRVLAPTPLGHGDLLVVGRHQGRVVLERGAGSRDGISRLALVLRRVATSAGFGSDPVDGSRTLHVASGGAGAGHARAPRWRPTSDLERPRRWPVVLAAAALLLAIGLAVEAAAPGRGVALRSEVGALSRPHLAAGLECADCHAPAGLTAQEGAPERQAACQGCHGPRSSARPGHVRAAGEGALLCADCHRVHERMEGVSFAADGTWTWWRNGAQDVSGASGAGRFAAPSGAQTVALVPLSACVRCHDASQASDPIGRCVDRSVVSPSELGALHGDAESAAARSRDVDDALDAAYALCFDEHQSHGAPIEALGAQHHVGRPAVWEAARLVVAENLGRRPRPEPPASATLWWMLAAVGLPLGGAALEARLRLRRAGVRAEAPAPEQRVAQVAAPAGKRMVPRIDALRCLGCSACVDACPYDVLALDTFVAQVARPELCCGIGSCQEKCPNGSLTLVLEDAGEASGLEDRPAVGLTLESVHRRGVYVAGDLTGLPLIKNAINQGAAAVAAVADDLRSSGSSPREWDCEVAIVGAGPAGLSAALACKRAGLSFRVLEAGEVAQSIRSFPRGKLVFDQPLSLPVVGDLWLQEATREELLGHWLRIVRDEGVSVSTHHRLERLVDAAPGVEVGFEVHASDPASGVAHAVFTARRVVLCVGSRGSARKLSVPVPVEAESRVHYALSDARTFAGRRCLVVGMGDVAMETAIALASQSGTRVVMSYRRTGYHSGSRRNQRALDELVQAGLVEVRWGSEVTRVESGRAWLESADGGGAATPVSWDAMFVMIGGVPPRALLDGLGLRGSVASGV